MAEMPGLRTARLILRPFTLDDAPVVRELAGAWEIAETTATIPHPYEEGMAEAWISTHQAAFDHGEAVTFAVVRRTDDLLVGAIGLVINKVYHLAELGYWIGKPYWNHGYGTEAAQEVVRYAFQVLGLNRVQAHHMTKNSASGRVMQKIGMTYEGTSKQSILRWGQFEDAANYAILRDEYPVSVRSA
jgi:RimJ/RimL family protein N-acetyltransferase